MTFVAFLSAVTVQASILLHLAGTPAAAFPLFDPVNESKWDPQWKPQLLGDRVQEGLVFFTDEPDGRATWLLDRYDAETYAVRYVVVRKATLDRIDVSIRPDGQARSVATVTYTRTALEAAANDRVRHFGEHFSHEGPHWESAINAVLAAGR